MLRCLMGSRSFAPARRWLAAAGLLVLPLVAVRPAAAASYTLDSGWSIFDFGSAGSTATPDFSFTAPASGATIKVTDAFLYGDQFELFDSGVSLGLTSVPGPGGATTGDADTAFATPDYSKGTFFVGAGSHDITLNAVQSPYGGGGAYFRADTATSVVPEPGSLALLASGGLPLLGFLRRRKIA